MNLMLIGNDIDKIALEIWKANTNYTILNKSPNVWNKLFTKYIYKRDVIVVTTSEQFVSKNINDVIDFMNKYDFIPVLVADSNKSIENNLYTGLTDEIPSTLLYIKNEKNKDYDEFVKISQGYLLGKGIIENENKTIRTSKKRKRTSAKK